MLDALKWATDYFMKCHVSDYEFYGQVGSFQLDHGYWGRPEEMNMSRPAYKIDAQHPGILDYFSITVMHVTLHRTINLFE